jgi:hypothetical protein
VHHQQHRWQIEKIFNKINFNYFVLTPLGSLPSSSLEGLSSLILFPLFATGVIDAGGKFAAGVSDTGGKFAHQYQKQ